MNNTKTNVETLNILTEEQKQAVIQGVITECAADPTKWQEVVKQAVKTGEKKGIRGTVTGVGIGIGIAALGVGLGWFLCKKFGVNVAEVAAAAPELTEALPEAAPVVADTVDAVASVVM